MNIKKHTQILSILSLVCTGFILAPSTALAERHGDDDSRHYSKSHHKTQVKSYSRHYNKHRPRDDYRQGYRHGHKHYRKHRQNYYVVREYYPSYNDRFWDNPRFSFGYQNDHIGFIFRD